MTLLCADITHNTNNCYKPGTLEKGAFSSYITGFTDPGATPVELIQNIFDGECEHAAMLKNKFTVTAYVPNLFKKDIPKLFKAMEAHSKHVSENKLSSAARTLSTLLCDWLKQCSPTSVNTISVQNQPAIDEKYTIQTAMDILRFAAHKLTNSET
jgi:hypothetical protein